MTHSETDPAMPGKAQYTVPKLKIFGLFTELTAAGSGPTGENTGSANPNRRP